MHQQNQSAIELGMQLASTLPDIMPQQADDRIKPIYQDIQQRMRVPVVNLIFRTLANYPEYLEPAWGQVRTLAGTRDFERAADALRAEALLEPPPQASDLGAALPHDAGKLRQFNDTIHYVLPKLLLVATALARTPLEHAVEPAASGLGMDTSALPESIADGSGKVEMVDPQQANAQVKRLFDAIRQRHGHPLVSSYYRGMANWPDFLEAAWRVVSPRVDTPDYAARRQLLIDRAAAQAEGWAPVSVTVAPAAQVEVSAILAAFRMRFIPEMLLDVALVKSLLDGADAARRSRFSAA